MINGDAPYPPSPSRLRSLSAGTAVQVERPRRGEDDLDGGENAGGSWICPLVVAKPVRWPSQKLTGLPGCCAVVPRRAPARRSSATVFHRSGAFSPAWAAAVTFGSSVAQTWTRLLTR
jgi:hypothetical protein